MLRGLAMVIKTRPAPLDIQSHGHVSLNGYVPCSQTLFGNVNAMETPFPFQYFRVFSGTFFATNCGKMHNKEPLLLSYALIDEVTVSLKGHRVVGAQKPT